MPLHPGSPLPPLEGLPAAPVQVLAFLKEGCETCLTLLPWLRVLAGRVPVTALVQESPEDAARWAAEQGFEGFFRADPEPFDASRAFEVAVVPTLVLALGDRVEGTLEGWERAGFEEMGAAAARAAGLPAAPLVTGPTPAFRPG